MEKINQNNRSVANGTAYIYSRAKLSEFACISPENMSRYCTINKSTGCPYAQPSLHTVIKIIAVLGIEPDSAYEALRLTMHCADAVESYPFLREYNAVINSLECKSRGKYGNEVVAAKINEYLQNAINYGPKYKGNPHIYKVFVHLR